MNRNIERYECIQILNALSVIEFPINNICYEVIYNKSYCSACPIVEYFILPICPSLLIVSA